MEPSATVKGLIINGVKDFMLEKYGEQGFKNFLKKTPQEDLPVWTEKRVIATSKIPASVYKNMFDSFECLWGSGDGKKFQAAAAYVAFQDLGSVMKFFMKVGSPSFVAQRFPSVWKQYFSAGEVKIIQLKTNFAEMLLEGASEYGRAGCLGTLGWTRAALEYAGAKNLHIDHSECLFQGRSACRFIFKWQ